MLFTTPRVFAALVLVSSTLAIAVPAADPAPAPVEIIVEGETLIEFATIQCGNERHGLKPICPTLKTHDKGCIRYVTGFDVTGVVTEVDLTFPEIKDSCDCIQACLNRPDSCAAYVWKFSTADSVTSGHRTCTLYSQFNLPSNVTIAVDIPNSSNINGDELVANKNNPQNGALVGQTFKDINLNTTVDNEAVSGVVWQLATGKAIC